MSEPEREFSASSNGDKWFLDHDTSTGENVVTHRANPTSGGAETKWSVASFLESFGDHPQGQALRRILSDLHPVDGDHTQEPKPVNPYPWTIRATKS